MGRSRSGQFQRQVEAEVGARAEPISMVELRWVLWEQRAGTAASLPKSFHLQLVRELRRGAYRLERRGLQDFQELVHLYPFKTLDRATRQMRHRLLPHLLTLADHHTKYSRDANEEHLLRRNRERLNSFRIRWERIEPSLFTAMGRRGDRDWALPLLCRGRQLFTTGTDLSCATDFAALVERAVTRTNRARLARVLSRFLEEVFPRDTRRSTRLASQLHGLAELNERGKSKLRTDVCEELLRLDGAYVSDLPGHRARPSGLRGMLQPHPTFSPHLDRLVARDALQRFQFVSGGADRTA